MNKWIDNECWEGIIPHFKLLRYISPTKPLSLCVWERLQDLDIVTIERGKPSGKNVRLSIKQPIKLWITARSAPNRPIPSTWSKQVNNLLLSNTVLDIHEKQNR